MKLYLGVAFMGVKSLKLENAGRGSKYHSQCRPPRVDNDPSVSTFCGANEYDHLKHTHFNKHRCVSF